MMRLVCPKCAAQYEVGEDAIPEAGRDVQCSACGHGWFQRRPSAPPQATLIAPILQPDVAQPFLAPPPFARTGRSEPFAASLATPEAIVPPAPGRKPLDEQVMAILREEALREAAARRDDAVRAGASPHGPLPLPASVPVPAFAEPPSAVPIPPPAPEPTLLRPSLPVAEESVLPRAVARHEDLPDIEAINSTLTAGTHSPGAAPPLAAEDRRPGFRAGFGLMMALVALAAAAYVLAPRIPSLVPNSAGAMSAYVEMVDDLRRKLDGTVTAAQHRVETLLLSSE